MCSKRTLLTLGQRLEIVVRCHGSTSTDWWSYGRGGVDILRVRSPYGHLPSHPCNAGTEGAGFSPTEQTLVAPSAKRREVSGGSHEG